MLERHRASLWKRLLGRGRLGRRAGRQLAIAQACSQENKVNISHQEDQFNPFTPKSDQFKFPLQPHQEYYITQYEEIGFSLLTRMKDDYYFQFSLLHLKGWENVFFELGNERVNFGYRISSKNDDGIT